MQLQPAALMTELDDHLAKVERYGFNRHQFPLSYKDHKLVILSNDAHETEDGRLLFDFTLHCVKCMQERGLSGRFSTDCANPLRSLAAAKVLMFDTFYENECK